MTGPILASQFRETLTSAHVVQPMGIIPKDKPKKFNEDHWETDASERSIDCGLVILIYQIFSKIFCLQWINETKQYTISSENNIFSNF